METDDARISWQTITTEQDFEVHDRSHLMDHADGCIPIGTAPDGLPLVMRVSRAASLVEPVLNALHAAEVSQLSEQVRAQLTTLNRLVQRERRGLGIAARGPFSSAPHYVSIASVNELFGDTLLARLLGSTSPLLLPEDTPRWQHNDHLEAKTSAGVLSMSAAEFQQLNRQLALRQHLCVPLDDAPALIVRQETATTKQRSLDLTTGRPFVFEDLRRMPSARFHSYGRVEGALEGKVTMGRLQDADAYRRALSPGKSIGWSVSKADLLQAVVEVARSLVPLHAAGLVHGDIKPGNVFLAADGATAHDSLDIEAGKLSAAGTKGWNAPEQIIARPCTPATDVFSLAQLVVRILDAAVFGDERSFVVPVGKGQRIRERMIATPDVFIDPTIVPLDDAGIAAWRSFLCRCLVLDPSKRVPDAATFAVQLAQVMNDHPVEGRRSVKQLPGRLVHLASGSGLLTRARRALTGEHERSAVWMVHDSNYANVHCEPWCFLLAIAA
jgi:hypothetical protein